MELVEQTLRDDSGGELLYLRVQDEALGGSRDKKPSASVVLAGDLSWPSASDLPSPGEWQHSPWARFSSLLERQDLSVVNLESPLPVAGQPLAKTGPHLRGDPSLAKAIRLGGFGAVSLANNHVRDWGDQGVIETLNACRAAGLEVVGAGANFADASEPLVTPAGGLRLGLLAVAENEFSVAAERSAGASPLRERRLALDVSNLRARTDAVVVVIHGGNELCPLPRPGLADLARAAAESGATAVVVHHQHVPSGLEIHGDTPIVYGTGNFLFPTSTANPDRHRGYLVQLELIPGGVAALNLFPYSQSPAAAHVEPMNGQALSAFASHLQRLSTIIASDADLEREWRRFISTRRASYLSTVLGLSHFERRLVRLGIWPVWRVRRSGIAQLLNVLRCESHREALLAILDEELTKLESPPQRPSRFRPVGGHDCSPIFYRMRLTVQGRLSKLESVRRMQWLPRESIEELQNDLLTRLLEHAYAHVPYYRRTLELADVVSNDGRVDLANFERIPLLDKPLIREHFDELASDDLAERDWGYSHSGGSTGEPIRIIHDIRDDWSRAVIVLFDEWSGRKLGEKQVGLWGARGAIWRTTADRTERACDSDCATRFG